MAMKKLCNTKGKKIHPSPSPSPSPSSYCNFLSALPAALLALAAALSPEEKEVLVYLLSDGPTGLAAGNKKPIQSPSQNQRKTHPPALGCGCFGCYKSFWARWNASPNHHLIHQILDAVEESLEEEFVASSRRRRRRRGNRRKGLTEEVFPTALRVAEVSGGADVEGDYEGYDDSVGDEEDDEFGGIGKVVEEEGDGRSPVKRFVRFIGERVWGVWN